jgi:predicted RNA binding protein YcfA (HicA-like mRNA interferase family)
VAKTKRTDLIKMLEKNGWYLKRNGGGHDLYTNGEQTETIPRHREINEMLAKAIIKRRGLK